MDKDIVAAAAGAAFLLVAFLPIVFADPQKRLTRKSYALRSLALFAGLTVALAGAGGLAGVAGQAVLVVLGAIYVTGHTLILLWSVHRTNDIGASKWWNLLFVVPFASLVWWIVLLVRKGRPAPATAEVFS